MLRAQDIDCAELDARLLTGAVLGLDLTGLISAARQLLTADQSIQLIAFAERRIAGEPIARIVGAKDFWGLSLHLSPDTLVPRPDTETIVEAALEYLDKAGLRDRPLRIADLGTGSGAILLALLSELPHAQGIGTDISRPALITARGNAERLGLAERLQFVACDYAEALAAGFDLIVSNPPYIPTADIERLDIEVRGHDPMRALDGGADGLQAYRIIAPAAERLLHSEGVLVVEVGHYQCDAVTELMSAAGLAAPRPPKTDLGGVRRAVLGQKQPR